MIKLGNEVHPHLKNTQEDYTTLSTTEIESLINSEKERAKNKEDELNELIINEGIRAQAAEEQEATTRREGISRLEGLIQNEITEREQADSIEVQRATNRENEIEEALNNEIARAKGAESTETQRATTRENEIEEALNNEISRSSNADATIEANLSAEVSAREQAITQEVTNRNTAITNAINALNVADAAVQGQYVTQVVEQNGKITIGRQGFSTNISQGDMNAPTGGAVYNAIQNLGTLYRIKPSVESIEELNALTENKAGDVRNVNDTGDNYVWDGEAWDRLGGTNLVNVLDFDDPAALDTSASEFISNISQTNGLIAATKKKLPIASTIEAGITKIADSYEEDGTLPITGTILSNAISNKADAANITAGTFGNADIEVPNGGSFKIPYITVSSQGIINAISEKTITLPTSDRNTDTKVTSAANHYDVTDTEVNGGIVTKSASSEAEATNIEAVPTDVITGVKVDSKGHLTGVVSTKLTSHKEVPEIETSITASSTDSKVAGAGATYTAIHGLFTWNSETGVLNITPL